MLLQSEKVHAADLYNRGMKIPAIAEQLGCDAKDVEGFLKTLPGYPDAVDRSKIFVGKKSKYGMKAERVRDDRSEPRPIERSVPTLVKIPSLSRPIPD